VVPVFGQGLKGKNILVLCYQSVDNKEVKNCSLGHYLYKFLKSKGAIIIDKDQAESVRKQLSPEKLEKFNEIKGVHMLDAEVITLMKISAAPQPMPIKRLAFKSVLVSFNISTINVSTGQKTFEYSEDVVGIGLSDTAAIKMAGQKFLKEQKEQFEKQFSSSFEQAEIANLWIYGIPSLQMMARFENSLKGMGYSESLKRMGYDGIVGKWQLSLNKGQDPMNLAIKLEAKKSLYLNVQGLKGSVIQLQFDPKRKLKTALFLETKNHKKLPKWYRKMQKNALSDQLLEIPWLLPSEEKEKGQLLFLKLSANKQKKKFILEMELKDKKGKKLISKTAVSKESELISKQNQLVQDTFNSL